MEIDRSRIFKKYCTHIHHIVVNDYAQCDRDQNTGRPPSAIAKCLGPALPALREQWKEVS